MEEEFFRIEVNEEGKRSLQRFAKLSLVVLVVGLSLSTIQLVSSLAAFQRVFRLSMTQKVQQNFSISIIFSVVSFVLQVLQIIFYRRFAALSTRGIHASDSESFNRSFRFLILQSVCFLLQLAVTLLVMIMRFIILR